HGPCLLADASAGEGRSDKDMRQCKNPERIRFIGGALVAAAGDRRTVAAAGAPADRRAARAGPIHLTAPEAAVRPPEGVMVMVMVSVMMMVPVMMPPGAGGEARAHDEYDGEDDRAGQHGALLIGRDRQLCRWNRGSFTAV